MRVSGLPSDPLGSLSNVPAFFTTEACGVNVSFLMLLQRIQGATTVASVHFPVEDLYSDVLDQVIHMYGEGSFGEDGLGLVKYLESTDIVGFSEDLSRTVKSDYFNYCVDINDRYQPRISINMKEQLNSFFSSVHLINDLHSNGHFYSVVLLEALREHSLESESDLSAQLRSDLVNAAQERYFRVLSGFNKSLCIYLILWIRAYRLSQARKSCLQQEGTVAFSHRFYGWSQPEYALSDDFKLEFKTNFGFGNASYFFFIMYYKNIQVFNFMDWVNYDIVEVSELHRYSIKYINKHRDEEQEEEQENGRITNSLWIEAISDAEEVCNLYINNEDGFVKKHIIENLENMISRLEEVIDADNHTVNRNYRRYNYEFSGYCFNKEEVIRIEAMNAKGYMISGVLSFIGQIVKLENIISVDSFLERINIVNKRLQPILIKELRESEDMKIKINNKIESNKNIMIDIWTKGDGSNSLNELSNLEKKGGLSAGMQSLFNKLQDEHKTLSKINKALNQDRLNLNNLIKNIERYHLNIENHFS